MKRIPDAQLHAMATSRNIDPGFTPKATRLGNNNEESRMQKYVIKWWSIVCAKRGIPEQLLFAIPNGGRRSVVSGAILKAEGMRKGCPDLFLAVPRGICSHSPAPGVDRIWSHKISGLFLEMKTPTGRVSPEQEVYHGLLEANGYRVAVCRSTDEAIQRITNYLNS